MSGNSSPVRPKNGARLEHRQRCLRQAIQAIPRIRAKSRIPNPESRAWGPAPGPGPRASLFPQIPRPEPQRQQRQQVHRAATADQQQQAADAVPLVHPGERRQPMLTQQ